MSFTFRTCSEYWIVYRDWSSGGVLCSKNFPSENTLCLTSLTPVPVPYNKNPVPLPQKFSINRIWSATTISLGCSASAADFHKYHLQRASQNPTASTGPLAKPVSPYFLHGACIPGRNSCGVRAQPSSTALSHLLPSEVDSQYWIWHIISPDFSASHRNNFFYLSRKLLHIPIIPFYLVCLFWSALTWSCWPCSLQVRD